MKTKLITVIVLLLVCFIYQSCKKIEGCMDPSAFNYNSKATKNTGCIAKVTGCTDPSAFNYNSSANVNSGCIPKIYGCTDPSASNYNSSANISNGSCIYTGNVVFYQMVGGGFGTTTVNILDASNHFETATITLDMNATPYCGQTGCATFYNLAVGTGSFTATDGSSTWTGNFTITPNGCLPEYLY